MREQGKHTPGPWQADPWQGDANKGLMVAAVTSEGLRIVCTVWAPGKWQGAFVGWPNQPTGEETKANAALIAATPKLLEAGKALLANGPCSDPDCCPTAKKNAEAQRLLAAAIAKAEGK